MGLGPLSFFYICIFFLCVFLFYFIESASYIGNWDRAIQVERNLTSSFDMMKLPIQRWIGSP